MDSAVNTILPSEETVAKLQPLASGANPLALEIAVNVAGARPASASGQRDLFSEDTATVLISENGAVIRLAAAVVTGQLLFLTDKRTNSEMVCQVVRKRTFRPTECYVELEFTEPAPNFWGLQIPAKPVSLAQLETAQRVESAETTVDDVPPGAPAAQGQGVPELKQEVESLREQIRSLPQTKAEAAKAEAEAALQQSAKRAEAAAAERSRIKPPAAPLASAIAPPAAPPPPPLNPPVVAATPTDGKAPGAGAEAAPDVAAKPLVRMALPKMTPAKEGGAKDSEAIDPLDSLLPKPDLDFSAVPVPRATNETRPRHEIHKPPRAGTGKFRLALFSGLLLAVVLVAAWYMNWLPLPSLSGITQMIHPANSRKMETGATQYAAPAIASRTAATPNVASPDAVAPEPANETSPQPASGAAEPADVPNPEAPAASAPAGPAAPKVKNTVAFATSPERASAKEKDGSAGSLRKNVPTATPSATAATAPPEPVARDAVLVPPKLLKSASPVYPPNAMRQYITGDVRVDALVEPDGRIGAMKILGGPVPLRQAAMDALKQYEYAPATQAGRAVATHITVTVKFWFNP